MVLVVYCYGCKVETWKERMSGETIWICAATTLHCNHDDHFCIFNVFLSNDWWAPSWNSNHHTLFPFGDHVALRIRKAISFCHIRFLQHPIRYHIRVSISDTKQLSKINMIMRWLSLFSNMHTKRIILSLTKKWNSLFKFDMSCYCHFIRHHR